jgi:chloramphenicol-sensitive protein RarD
MQSLPALEIIVHRTVWSFVFGLALVLAGGQWHAFIGVFRKPRLLLVLLGSALLISCNWLIYVWAVNRGRMVEASLGYYITPLVNVLLGMLFLKERLRPPQRVAVLLAAAGVTFLTVSHGVFPWISLALAGSFGLYGLIRKVASVSALIGLTVETLLIGGPALLYLVHLDRIGQSAFRHQGPAMDLLLIGSGVLTGLPLLLFTLGARRITMATLGFIQYLGPSCILLLGVLVYNEPFSKNQIVTFAMIWSALALYSWDAVRFFRHPAGRRPGPSP